MLIYRSVKLSNSIVRSVRIDDELFNKFDSIYGKEFLGKFVNQSLAFALKGKEYFSVIFWQEFSKVVFNKE